MQNTANQVLNGRGILMSFPIRRPPQNEKHGTDYVRQHQDIVKLIRKAAAKPRLGFYFRNPGENPAEGVVSFFEESKTKIPSADNFDDGADRFKAPFRYSYLDFVPPIYYQSLLQLLWADALSSAKGSDSKTTIADIQAIGQMADQSLDGFPLVSAYRARFAILLTMFRTVGDVLAYDPQAFSNEQLQQLSQLVSSFSDKQLDVDFSTEEKVWKEACTHFYAADGFLNETGVGRIRGSQVLSGLDGLTFADQVGRTVFLVYAWNRGSRLSA